MLAQRDDKIVVVSRRAVVVDDLERLTPAITAKGDAISDYKTFIAPIAAQELPTVSEAQAIQDQRNGYDPEFEALMRGLYANLEAFAHTLLTPFRTVGVAARIRPVRFCLECATYDCIGLPRTARNGFDSR